MGYQGSRWCAAAHATRDARICRQRQAKRRPTARDPTAQEGQDRSAARDRSQTHWHWQARASPGTGTESCSRPVFKFFPRACAWRTSPEFLDAGCGFRRWLQSGLRRGGAEPRRCQWRRRAAGAESRCARPRLARPTVPVGRGLRGYCGGGRGCRAVASIIGLGCRGGPDRRRRPEAYVT
jgi:hypothetical protein